MLKKCLTCGTVKFSFEFYDSRPTCAVCFKKAWRERRATDPEADRARCRANYKKHRLRRLAEKKAYRQNNLDDARRRDAAHKRSNPAKMRAAANLKRARKMQRTPPWANVVDIAAVYANCPPGHHVDHIIPLKGKGVSGLHVTDNLQYLPAAENLAKGNRYP